MRQVTGLFVLRRGCPPPKVILLVEDDPTTAQLCMRLFSEETPYYVYWATSGWAAWHFTQHVKPQLFLLEYSLPDTNGIQLYDRLHARKELETVPALIVGACLKEGEDAMRQRGLLAVGNPFDLDKFLSTIERVLASSSGSPVVMEKQSIIKEGEGKHMARYCSHLDQICEVTPSANGCEDCLKMGDTWVHLRLCLTCGHVGCCDDSKNKHATRHFHTANHPLVQSFEPGEDWVWCYIDELLLESA